MKVLKIIMVFVAGILSGVFIYAGCIMLTHRESWHIGGEAFILPLIILLIYIGWCIRTEWNQHNLSFEKARSFREGYVAGIKKANESLKYNPCGHQIDVRL